MKKSTEQLQLEERISQWITCHEEELVKDIGTMIQIKSVSKKTDGVYCFGKGCANALTKMLEIGASYGLHTQNYEFQCGKISYGAGENEIALWGHLDVVEEGEGWTYPPYACTRVGDFLFGRGVQDNKGPSIAALYGIRCMKELEIPVHCRISQIVGCDEERAMEDVEYYISNYPPPDFSIITDCNFPVCYGEKGILEVLLYSDCFSHVVAALSGGNVSNVIPDEAMIKLRYKEGLEEKIGKIIGTCKVDFKEGIYSIKASGMAGHAAFPEGTINAIAVLAKEIYDAELLLDRDKQLILFLSKVCSSSYGEEFAIESEDEVSGKLTCVGTIVNMEEGRLSLVLNIRYPIFSDSIKILDKISCKSKEWGFEMKVIRNSFPNYYDKSSPFVKVLMDVYQNVTNDKVEPYTMGGGIYARKIPNGVGFGPGMSMDISSLNLLPGHGSCHSPDEVQLISNLCQAIKIYCLALIRLDEEFFSKDKYI